MTFLALKSALGVDNGIITNSRVAISGGTFTNNIDDIIKYCYDNNPVVIDQAQLVKEEEQTTSVTIKGKSNFLNVPDLEVNARFYIDNEGNIQMCLKYHVLGDTPGPDKWTFSRSFPQLPKVPDNTKPALFNRAQGTFEQPQVSVLDELLMFNAYFIVASEACSEPSFNVPLKWGINFVGNLRPQGALKVMEGVFGQKNKLTIHGTIRKPLVTETPGALESQYTGSPEKYRFPWTIADDFPKGIPGILLNVDLDLKYELFDGVEFSADTLKLYTPLNSDWTLYNTNPPLMSTQAYTGAVNMERAGIKMDMISPFEYGIDEFQLIGIFKGISLNNLSQLAGLTGSSDSPLSLLPDEIKNVGDKIGQLELMSASISMDYSDLKNISISNASFTVGMPELNWTVWGDDSDDGTKHFAINSIACSFNFDNPFSVLNDDYNERQVGVTVFGQLEIENVPFNVYAKYEDGFSVFAELAEAKTIPLKEILSKYAPGLPAPSDLTINKFNVGIEPGYSYSMALGMANAPTPWVIPIGPAELTVQDVAMGITYRKGEGVTGSVSGKLKFNDTFELDIAYDTPDDIAIRSYLPAISVREIVDTLTNQSFEIPDAFDLHFKNNSVLIQKQADNYVFQLATEIEELGLVALKVQKISNQWGAAFGIDMVDVRPSSLPGLSFLNGFETLFDMKKFMLVVSSFDGVDFQFPDMAQFRNPALATKKVSLPKQANTLIAGLNIYAQWQINTADQKQKLLQNLLGLDPLLGVTLQVGKNPEKFSKLFVSYDTTINGLPFRVKVGGQIMDGSIGFFLSGSVDVEIQGQKQTFDVTLLFVTNGAFISATMKGHTAIDFQVFQLSNLALEVGVNWEGIPSLGVAGTIEAGFESSIAVFFDSAEPQKSLVAGSLSDLSLRNIVEAFAGDVASSEIDSILDSISIKGTGSFTIPGALADDLNDLKLESVAASCLEVHKLVIPTAQEQTLLVKDRNKPIWYLTDKTLMRHYQFRMEGENITVSTQAQFYCAPQATSIGSIMFPQGFYINGALSFLGFKASVTVDINANKGISIDANMDPIIIGHRRLFSITAINGTDGPKVSLSTFQNLAASSPEFVPPHFYINGQVIILGLKRTTYANVTSEGAQFLIEGSVIPYVTEGTLAARFNSFTDMSVHGKLFVGVDTIDLGPLGSYSLGTGVYSMVTLFVNGSDMGASLTMGFKLANKDYSFSAKLDINTADITKLADIAWNEIKKFMEDLFKDWKTWANTAKDALGWTEEKISGVLQSIFNISEEDAKTFMRVLFAACPVTAALMAL